MPRAPARAARSASRTIGSADVPGVGCENAVARAELGRCAREPVPGKAGRRRAAVLVPPRASSVGGGHIEILRSWGSVPVSRLRTARARRACVCTSANAPLGVFRTFARSKSPRVPRSSCTAPMASIARAHQCCGCVWSRPPRSARELEYVNLLLASRLGCSTSRATLRHVESGAQGGLQRMPCARAPRVLLPSTQRSFEPL